jgi:hypothetical protein
VNSILPTLESQFTTIDRRSHALLDRTSDVLLYKSPRDSDQVLIPFTIGEYLLRSAATIEQVAGGITTRLWDDPFEWTLPEKLSTVVAVRGYLCEVEQARVRTFEAISSDANLSKQIPSPVRMMSLFEILVEAVAKASHFQGRAYSVFQALSETKLPPI